MTTETPQKNNKVIILAVLLAVSVIGNIYQGMQTKGKSETIEVERIKYDTLFMQFQDMDKMYDESIAMVEEFKNENTALNADIENKVAELQQIKEEIASLKKNVKSKGKLFDQLKKKYDRMNALNAELENKIDELLLENKVLFDKNIALKGNVDSLTGVTNALDKKVNTGSKLKAEYVIISSFKKKESGYKETKLAKRANKIEANFMILDNAIAEKTEKTLYLRIIAPNGKVLGTPAMNSDSFKAENGDEIKFSSKKQFTNTTEKQAMKLIYEELDLEFEKGEYKVEIYVDGYLSGSSSYSLK